GAGGVPPSSSPAKPPEEKALPFHSRLGPAECARRLEGAVFPLNVSLSTFSFHSGRVLDDGTISFGLERLPRLRELSRSFNFPLWQPYFSGTLKPDPETKGTTIVGSFGLRPGARGLAVFFVVCTLIATGVSFLLREWRLLIIPVITAIPFAALPVTRWTCRDDPSELTAFLRATLQATDEGKR